MRFHRLLICFLAVLIAASCSTIRRNNTAGKAYGGGFETIGAASEKSNIPHVEAEKMQHSRQTAPIPKHFRIDTKSDRKAVTPIHQKYLSKLSLFKNHLQPPDTTVRDSTAKLPVEKHARLGFIFSMAGLVTAFIPVAGILAIPLMIAGLVLGIVGKKNIRENPGKYRGSGMAVAAIVIPIVLIMLIVLILLIYIAILLALLGV